MLEGRVKNIMAPLTAIRLDDIPCKEVNITAKPSNKGSVFVGGPDVSNTVYGCVLVPGASMRLEVPNSNMIYICGTSSGTSLNNETEGVSYFAVRYYGNE
ncbi:hypothetical protein XO47_15200 [Listeria monocytogenes]|nr:hypothetical protein [Listeria monocytogenes]